jgi:hypothetical protein
VVEKTCSLLWKERLNSDGQQFHQYEQKESPEIIENKKKTQHTYDFGNLVLAWNRHTNVAGV